ncbi:MAG: hypothetical protein GX957_10965 [Clostridiaceae bacterium]|nr:hypothetical protein [Clostridiaceae bacterium]
MKKNMLRKQTVRAVLLIFIFSAVFTFSGLELKAQATEGPADTSKYKPEFMVSTPDDSVLVAGKTGTVKINLKNVSLNTSAYNLLITPVYKDVAVFTSVNVLTEVPVRYLQYSKSTEFELSASVDKFVQDGVYPLTFLLSYTNAWNDNFAPIEYTVYIKVKSYETSSNLKLNLKDNIAVQAGGVFDLPLTLYNDGTLSAKEVKVSITGLSQDTFSLSSGTGVYDYYRIFGGELRNLNYKLIASSTLKTGSYPITFLIEYKDEKGNPEKVEQQVWVPVAGANQSLATLEITEITSSSTQVKPDEIFDVNVKIENRGEFDSGQIKVTAEVPGALLPVTQNLHILSTIKKGETKEVKFSFQPDANAPRGGAPITIKVDSVDSNESISIARAISVFVDSSGAGGIEAGKDVPKIIVSKYSFQPDVVHAGENFTLNVQFQNTHSQKTVRNIKGNFIVTEESSETGSVFSPVGSSNTFYIDEINPKGTYDWNLTLYTIPDAKSKTYTVTISFEYEDNAGNPYKADEIIGIPVYQPSRFEVSDISLPYEVYMGTPVYVYFEMYNMGKTDIYNVKFNIEGDEGAFTADPKSSYFGNFTPGYREYFEFTIIPNMAGEINGRLVFQYETASGELQEYVKEISMNVMEMMMPIDDFPVGGPIGEDFYPEDHGGGGFIGSVWFWVIIGVVLAGAAATVVILVKRKRKKREEFEF